MNIRGGYYGPALQTASIYGYKEMVQLLLEKGADVDFQGEDYGSVLQAASECGHKRTVQLLLAKGANFNRQRGFHPAIWNSTVGLSLRQMGVILIS